MLAAGAGGRELARVTAFTDAAVAIALTLLVLPLVEVAHSQADQPMTALWQEHSGDLLAFVVSFLVIALFWRAHRRIFEIADRINESLLSLNTFWLLGVVFLPVPTAILTFDDGSTNAPAILYLANLCYVSALNLALCSWLAAHPKLLHPGGEPVVRKQVRTALTITIVMAAGTALAVAFGSLALLILLALPLFGRFSRQRPAGPSSVTATDPPR